VLRLGVAETIVHTWLPSLIKSVNTTYPNLSLEIEVDISPNLPHVFQTFSPQRLFTALDSTVTEVLFLLSDKAVSNEHITAERCTALPFPFR